MKKVNRKSVANIYKNSYLHSTIRHLHQCYTSYSNHKANAYEYCVDLCIKYNGRQLRILGYNSMTFSVGFIGEYNGKPAFFYITRDYDRVMLLKDIEKKLS